jgi:hypothetical protein
MNKASLPLLRVDGTPFPEEALNATASALESLNEEGRTLFRDSNGDAIARADVQRLLVVSGPGTGKSHLFLGRIKEWLVRYDDAQIAVATFVRKLAADLAGDVSSDRDLSEADKERVLVSTLHKIARSILERSRGTNSLRLRPYIRMVGTDESEDLIWADTLCLLGGGDLGGYAWGQLKAGLFDASPPSDDLWPRIRDLHQRLQQYYNAVTFPDLIVLATTALREDPSLVGGTLFMLDEFQDFNRADEQLIEQLTRDAVGLTLVGDDDQVLYDRLRRSHAEIIRGYWERTDFANAMLPLCGRCGYHICKVAEAFLSSASYDGRIPKLLLPLHDEGDAVPVQVVAATTPLVGVGLVENFIDEHREEIADRQEALARGAATDPFLLVLTPSNAMTFMTAEGRRRLVESIDSVSAGTRRFSEDYWRLQDYVRASLWPEQNWLVRKVLSYEGLDPEFGALLWWSASLQRWIFRTPRLWRFRN